MGALTLSQDKSFSSEDDTLYFEMFVAGRTFVVLYQGDVVDSFFSYRYRYRVLSMYEISGFQLKSHLFLAIYCSCFLPNLWR